MWQAIAGPVLGALGGAMAPTPYGGQQFNTATTADDRSGAAGASLGHLERVVEGRDAKTNQAAASATLTGATGKIRAGGNAARARETERLIQGGGNPTSASHRRRLQEIDEAQMGAIRGTVAPVYGQLALQAPQRQLAAAGALNSFVNAQDQIGAAENARMDQYRAGVDAHGSDLWRGIMGAGSAINSFQKTA